MIEVLVKVKATVDQMVADAYTRIDQHVLIEEQWHEYRIAERAAVRNGWLERAS